MNYHLFTLLCKFFKSDSFSSLGDPFRLTIMKRFYGKGGKIIIRKGS